jgi:copper oxidase (laccase) domain-containing protein
METPDFLAPLLRYPGLIAQFIERVPGIPVSTDRQEVLERLEPIHRAEVDRLGVPWKYFRRAEQVHGNKVALVGDIGSNFPVEGVDGLVCAGKADCMLGIYVADCAAVWLYDTVSHGRALLHSGRAGTESNSVAQGLKALKSFCYSKPEQVVAVISPCIRPPHYEMDIPAKIKQQLIDAGVPENQIFDSNLDTASNLDRFYSYRIEKGNTGRMLALFGRVIPHTTTPLLPN